MAKAKQSSRAPEDARAYRNGAKYARASAARKRRKRIRAAVALAFAVVLVGVGVCAAFSLSGGTDGEGSAQSTFDAPAEGASGQAEDQAVNDSGQGAADAAQAQGSDGASSSDDSSLWGTADDPRNADYAVDPNRQTEWRTKTDGTKTIWLTFDDGPSALTQEVLDVLNRYGVKATFFVTNEEPSYAYMIKEAYRQGNTIGLHSYTHDYATVYASEDAFFDDLDKIGAVVEEQIGYVPCFIRFPGGSSNSISAKYTKGIMTALVSDVQERGYQYFDWNISCGDGAAGHTAEELAAYACDGDDYTNIVLLMHDSAGHEATVEALPTIIEHYQSLGYTFKAIDRTALASHHGLNN